MNQMHKEQFKKKLNKLNYVETSSLITYKLKTSLWQMMVRIWITMDVKAVVPRIQMELNFGFKILEITPIDPSHNTNNDTIAEVIEKEKCDENKSTVCQMPKQLQLQPHLQQLF